MKKKHQGIFNLAVLIISFIFMVCYTIYYADNLSGSIHIAQPESLPEIDVPDKIVMKYIEYLKQHLTGIVSMKKNNRPVDLKLFGYKAHEKIKKQDKSRDGMENGFAYDLSLAFSSENHHYCVIGDKLYSEKAVLPDGGIIEQIENNRVMISKNNKKIWIYTSPSSYPIPAKQDKQK